jgi:protein O-GlcNAc transferase
MGSNVWTDILVSDSIASPPEWEAHYTEKLMLVPNSYYMNDFPYQFPDVGLFANASHAAASANMTRADFGLPEDAFVFVCFSRAEKIQRSLFYSWLEILRRTPRSVLWLLRDTKSKTAGETIVTSSFHAAAAAGGVDPSRIIFADSIGWKEHVRRGALADLFLDTWAYNAHSTGCNSLWAGVPLLTKAEIKMAARVAAGMNRAAEADVYTARTREEYVEIAVCQEFRV